MKNLLIFDYALGHYMGDPLKGAVRITSTSGKPVFECSSDRGELFDEQTARFIARNNPTCSIVGLREPVKQGAH